MARSASAFRDIGAFAFQIRNDDGLRRAVRVFDYEMNIIGQQRLLRVNVRTKLDEDLSTIGALRDTQSVIRQSRFESAQNGTDSHVAVARLFRALILENAQIRKR